MLVFLIGIAQALYQQQAGQYDWTIRSFGELKAVTLKKQIQYHGVDQNGLIDRENGDVISRNNWIACDTENFVHYDQAQKVILHQKDVVTVLAEKELTSVISLCLHDKKEFILVAQNRVIGIGEKSYDIERSVIGGGLVSDVATILAKGEKENQVCVIQYGENVYCFEESTTNSKVVQVGSHLVLNGHILIEAKTHKKLDLSNVQQWLQTGVIVKNAKSEFELRNLFNELIKKIQTNSKGAQLGTKFVSVSNQHHILHIEWYDTDHKSENLYKIPINSDSPVLNVFILDISKKLILIQLEDLNTIHCDSQIKWQNEQSLASVQAVFFDKYDNPETTHKNSYYHSLEKNGPHNPLYIIQNFVLRVTNEVNDLIEGVFHLYNHLINPKSDAEEILINYGLKQKVYFLTSSNLILSYDSQTKQLLNRQQIPNLDNSFKLVAHHLIQSHLIQKGNSTEPSAAQVFLYYSTEKQRLQTYLLDMESLVLQQVASASAKPILWTLTYKQQSIHDNLIIIIHDDHSITAFPRTQHLNFSEILLYQLQGQYLLGFQLQGSQLKQIWNIKLTDEVLQIRSSYHAGEQNPRVAIWDDRKVLFKLIDYSNFCVLTSDGKLLKLWIVNAKTGKIIFQSVQHDVDFEQPINLEFDEHQVFISYYNKEQSIFEIWTVEIYHAKIEVSFLKMLEDYYLTKSHTHLNYYKADLEAFFLQQVYAFPLGIQKLSISRTLKSLTKKNLLIITLQGQVHSLDRNLVSARRREKADVMPLEYSLQSAELPPYQYLLPVNYLQILSYYQQFESGTFFLEPTNLESTSLLVYYGKDIFFTYIAPDKTYDMLQDDFSYVLLIITIIVIVIATYVLKTMAKSTRQTKQFYRN